MGDMRLRRPLSPFSTVPYRNRATTSPTCLLKTDHDIRRNAMEAESALRPEAAIRFCRVPAYRLGPVRDDHPAPATAATAVVDEVVGAPVLVQRAVARCEPVVAVVHLYLAALPRQHPVAVDRAPVRVARAVDARGGSRGHGRVEVCMPSVVAIIVELAPGAVNNGVGEVIYGLEALRAVGDRIGVWRLGCVPDGAGEDLARRRCGVPGPDFRGYCGDRSSSQDGEEEENRGEDQRETHLEEGSLPAWL